MPILHNEKIISADFEQKKNCPFFETFCQFWGKFFLLKIGRNENFIMQGGYGEQTLLNKFFHLLLKKFCPFSDFTFESEVS